MTRILLYLIIFLFLVTKVNSQVDDNLKDQTIDYSFTLGIGLSSDLDSIAKHNDRSGLALNLKFLVQSYNHLSLGLETAYINISKFREKNVQTDYGSTDVDNRLTAIPILFVAQHKLYYFQIFGGYGPAYIISSIDCFDDKSVSTEWDYSLMAGISYSYNFHSKISINLDFKYYTIPSLYKNILNGQLSFTYKL